MIKHHPRYELIQSFVHGDLPASLSAAISIHAEMCSTCQKQITLLTDQVAELSFEESQFKTSDDDYISNIDFEKMIEGITQSNDIDVKKAVEIKTIYFKSKPYNLPITLNNIGLGKTANIGRLAKSRLQLNENEIHTNLLHMEPGGSVPEHTHKGFELTLLLEGSFHDDRGIYVKGDFIMLDGNHTHRPVSDSGCLCYTVANDALHFTQGINKLLNPIGSFIY
jgi:putative transcriptional regulator